MKKQENTDYCLGNALMEERSCQAKWVIREKLNAICKNIGYYNKNKYDYYFDEILALCQEILNIVENEL